MKPTLKRIGLPAALALAPVSLTAAQPTQPDRKAAASGRRSPSVAMGVPSSQPADDGPRGGAPPSVVGAGVSGDSRPGGQPGGQPAANEVTSAPLAKPDKAAALTGGQGGPPPVPTADEVMRWLLPGEQGVDSTGKTPSAGKVLDTLATNRQVMVVKPGPPGKDSEVVSPDALRQEKSKLLPDGYVVPDRVGQVVHDRGRWMFAFEADKSGAADPPLVLLPNSMLEEMLHQSNYGRNNVKFRISGEVTQYQQTNYLLLRKVLIEYNMDRFVN